MTQLYCSRPVTAAQDSTVWTVCVRAASWDSRDKNTLLGNSLVSEAFGLETNALILGSCSNSIHVDGKLIRLLSKDFLLQDIVSSQTQLSMKSSPSSILLQSKQPGTPLTCPPPTCINRTTSVMM